jgi:hypothetical protein
MRNVERAFKEYRREVTAAYWSFFTWKGINNIASDNEQIYKAIHCNHLTWNAILWSLQTTFHIALGRLFDSDGDAFSADRFLRFCIDNIDEFDATSLQKRKIAESGGTVSADELNDLMGGAYAPTIEDFQRLRGELTKRRRLYEKTYRPIRHKVYAHKQIDTLDNIGELFSKTNIDHIEDFLWIMYQIETVVYNLFHFGKLNPIGHFPFNVEQRVLEDVKSLLQKLKTEHDS